MTRIALVVAYEGQAFAGWQIQPEAPTVQQTLESAIGQIAGEKVSTICAGRTDAGVHASGQVVHFDTGADRALQAWVRGVNALLPASIAVQRATVVDPAFHARFDAIEREYRYLLFNAPVRHPLLAGRVGWVFRPLDADRMQDAAQWLAGRHDFSSFRASQCQARSPVREMRLIECRRRDRLIEIRFRADAFLHHMIRNIVGSLVYVGDGRRPAQWIGEVLAARDRRVAAPTFEPDGLYFIGPTYPVASGLAPLPVNDLLP